MKKFLLLLTMCLCLLTTAQPVDATASSAPTLGFKHIEVPNNIANDEFVIKAIYFAMKEEAGKVEKLKVNYKNTDNEDYYVEGMLTHYNVDMTWEPAHVITTSETESSEKYKWTDDKGKERTRTVSKEHTKVIDVPARYKFKAVVTGTFYLVKARTGQAVVEYSETFTDDKPIDAYHKFLKGFYKKVNEKFE